MNDLNCSGGWSDITQHHVGLLKSYPTERLVSPGDFKYYVVRSWTTSTPILTGYDMNDPNLHVS